MFRSPVPVHHARIGSGMTDGDIDTAGSGRDAAIGRANRSTLRGVELAFALGAKDRIDDVGALLEADRFVGAFRFAGAANSAVVLDDLESHGSSPVVAGLAAGFACCIGLTVTPPGRLAKVVNYRRI
jgi:hypothetical protein